MRRRSLCVAGLTLLAACGLFVVVVCLLFVVCCPLCVDVVRVNVVMVVVRCEWLVVC